MITNEGNVFYHDKSNKTSFWTAPEELKGPLEALLQVVASKSANVKRKAENSAQGNEAASKKARIEDGEEDEDDSEEDAEEEEWQREAAEQLAAEAEQERLRKEAEEKQKKKESELEAQRAFGNAQIAMPQKVDLSLEEGKALFKVWQP